jgi:hypothetical protein
MTIFASLISWTFSPVGSGKEKTTINTPLTFIYRPYPAASGAKDGWGYCGYKLIILFDLKEA